jgi:4-methylaminobutanoate oxidase (formaldehyde-forming)
MAGFTVDDPGITLLGRETILRDGEFAGYLSSGGFGYTIGKPVGYGYLRRADGVSEDWIAAGAYELVVAGERIPARVHLAPLHDPEGARVKA